MFAGIIVHVAEGYDNYFNALWQDALFARMTGRLDMSKLLSMVGRNSAPHHPNPAETQWRCGVRGASRLRLEERAG
jgi:hypothetical protein